MEGEGEGRGVSAEAVSGAHGSVPEPLLRNSNQRFPMLRWELAKSASLPTLPRQERGEREGEIEGGGEGEAAGL